MYASPNEYIPQCVSDRRPLLVWAVIAAIALLVTVLIAGAPLARANGFTALSFIIYQAFSYVCHQLPERSFFIDGYQFAVCTRCTGVYFGFAAAVICYPLITSLKKTQSPERKWLFIAAMPLVIDFGLGLTGVWENTRGSRFATGALLGSVAVFFVMPALAELGLRFKTSRTSRITNQRFGAMPNVSDERFAGAPSDYSSPHRRI
ncbi:MAG TPA: DUF2085 domain-containing protein [Pyrinomonadaceae bacterium]|nr:DUF2085 domain-containing protein [Pyrinomonadaceae bacterium]